MAVYRVTVSADQPECNHLSMVPIAEYKTMVGDNKKATVEGATQAALEAATKAVMDGVLKGCWVVNCYVESNGELWHIRIERN